MCELLRGFHSAAANMTYSFDGGHAIRGRPAFTGDNGVEHLPQGDFAAVEEHVKVCMILTRVM